jgi:hypothetical protein
MCCIAIAGVTAAVADVAVAVAMIASTRFAAAIGITIVATDVLSICCPVAVATGAVWAAQQVLGIMSADPELCAPCAAHGFCAEKRRHPHS